MGIPAILTGSAGRAIDDIMRVRGYGSAASFAMHSVVDGSGSAMSAANALHTVDGTLLHGSWTSLVNGAKPGLRKALGAGQPHLSGTLHAELAEIRSARSILTGGGTDVARQISTARFGANAADDLIAAIDQTMPALQSAARRTAAFRVAVGAVGIGGAIAGVHHLASANDDDSVPMAPGPFREPGAPDLVNGPVYA
jgi:hypothetical protein